MNKIIYFILIITTNIFSQEVHKRISLIDIYSFYGKGIPNNYLSFDQNKSLKINVNSQKGEYLYTVEKLDKTEKILSVFFYDISGEGKKELFILTEIKGVKKLYVYNFQAYSKSDTWSNENLFGREYEVEKRMKNFLKIGKKINAESIKEELAKFNHLNYYVIGYWSDIFKSFGVEKFDVASGKVLNNKILKNEDLDGLEEGESYFLDYGNGLFGYFIKDNLLGYILVSVFEGYMEGNQIITNGKWTHIDEETFIIANYKDGIKNGSYKEISYDNENEGNFINGVKADNWIENGFEGKYENGLKVGIWEDKERGIKSYYDRGELIKEEHYRLKNKSLEKVIYYGDKIISNNFDEENRLEKRVNYTKDFDIIEGLNFGSIKRSPVKSDFAGYDFGKAEFIGDFFLDENQKYKGSNPIELNEKTYKLYNNTWGNKLKLFSIKFEDKEIFVVMERYPQGFAIDPETYVWFGIREIFEGVRVKESIESFADIMRNGKIETFSVNYYGDDNGNRSCLEQKGNYLNNLKNDKWYTFFYPSIKWFITTYNKGKKDGLHQVFNVENGEVETEGYYKNDEKVGEWKTPQPFFIFGG